MKTHYSYGIIALMYHEKARYTILVQAAGGNHRGFPKGHAWAKETQLQTMRREFEEETGLKIKKKYIDTSVVYSEEYDFIRPKKQKKIHKTVVYHPAILPYQDITLLKGYSEGDGEIINKKILTLHDAQELLSYDTARKLLLQIRENYLKKQPQGVLE